MEQNNENKKTNINKTWLLVAGLVALTVVLLVVSLTTNTFQNRPESTKKVQMNLAHTSLAISEEIRNSTASGTYEVDVNIDTSKNEVITTQLELSYNPKEITNIDIRPGSFFKNPTVAFKRIDASNGRVTYALANKSNEKPVKGKGVIAVITFRKIVSGETYINFLPQTQVGAPGISESVLRESASGLIDVIPSTNSAQAIATPSPTR
jgi:hypothetical protein